MLVVVLVCRWSRRVPVLEEEAWVYDFLANRGEGDRLIWALAWEGVNTSGHQHPESTTAVLN